MASKKNGGGSNTKEKNGSGNSKPILSSEQQDEIRRAKKKRQSTGGSKGSSRHGETGFLEGLEQDKIREEALYLFDALYPVMCSPAPSSDMIIKFAFSTFITSYTEATTQELRRTRQYRNQFALAKALATISDDRIQSFARTQIELACRRLHHMKKESHTA